MASSERPDYALAPNAAGDRPVLHRADCPKAREQAARGEMVVTMMACEKEPPADLERCACLRKASGVV